MARPDQRTLKLVLEYHGSELSGWQRQKNGPSVQEHLERALAEMLGEPVAVVGASRTDAGVHALGQVAHLRTNNWTIPEHGFRRGLNSLLPPSIAVVEVSRQSPSFHARFSARGKRYRYQLIARPDRSPLLRDRAWHCPPHLDVERMARAAPALVGHHDFSAFRAAGCGAKHAIRRITDARVRRLDQVRSGLVAIDVAGEAFLRNMVRIIAGTLVEVGESKRSAEEIPEILASRDRRRAGVTAPARGLTLVEVLYSSEDSAQGVS